MFAAILKHAVLLAPLPVLLTAVCTARSSRDAASGEDAKKLLQERRAVLQQIVELQREAYQRGEAKADSVLLAQKDLLDAALELAERPAQRVELYERFAETMQQLEEMSHRLYEAAKASPADHLKAKAARLKAQADLIRARAEAEQKAEGAAILIDAERRLNAAAPGTLVDAETRLNPLHEVKKPSAGPGARGSDTEYFCPLHPNVVRSRLDPNGAIPKCPICGMPLALRHRGEF